MKSSRLNLILRHHLRLLPTSTTSQGQSTSTPSSTSTPTTTTRSTTRRSSSTRSTPASIESELQETVERAPSQREPSEIGSAPLPEPLPQPVVLEDMTYRFSQGWNLVSFPVRPVGIGTLAEIYDTWGFADYDGTMLIYLADTFFAYPNDEWLERFSIWRYGGVFVHLDSDLTVEVRGVRSENASRISIEAGINLIGFPTIPASITRPSDLLSDTIYSVIVAQDGGLKSVSRSGDPGDDLLTDGQAVMLFATRGLVLELSESILSAPSVKRRGTLAMSWGAMKR